MAIVFLPVVMPTSWNGEPLSNGRLGPCDLKNVFMPGAGWCSFHQFTARAVSAMQIICKAETGFDLSSVGDYRSADEQWNLFHARYTSSYVPLRNVLTSRRTGADGKSWYLRKGMAPVASIGKPGVVGFFPSSNHGLGIANDFSVWKFDPTQGRSRHFGITSVPQAWEWVQQNAQSFGFSWEGAKPGEPGWEPWHLRHVVGNDVSQRVKDIEAWFAALDKASS